MPDNESQPILPTQQLFGSALRDCYRAFHELKSAEDGAQFRLRWITVIVLLRAVGHVLEKVDARRSPILHDAVTAAWARLRANRYANLIFFEFIERERNLVLKEYEFDGNVIMTSAGDSPLSARHAMRVGDRVIYQLDLLSEALRWWEGHLGDIEGDAESQMKRAQATASTPARKARRDRLRG
ncbi:MAG TPA: hypothetical protein VK148_11910 [Xanthobacteraceae bacterium]|nr:hypothetical protein [Xanthobacteraceae bacterium]